MKQSKFLISLILCTFCLFGCSAPAQVPVDSESVRTFAPEDAASPSPETEKRGILQSLTSPGSMHCAYVFTYNAAAEPVEYCLAVLNKNEMFDYDEADVIYRSNFLFDIEWGDDATLMVSLNEKETAEPAPLEAEGVMVMFGKVSASAVK